MSKIHAFLQKLQYSILRSHSCQLWKGILESVYENKPFFVTFSMEEREKKA